VRLVVVLVLASIVSALAFGLFRRVDQSAVREGDEVTFRPVMGALTAIAVGVLFLLVLYVAVGLVLYALGT
jgi:hypothetical protein